ncbi:hypothetical protein DYB28_004600 [Aphanomyces astaci]|uniref:EF-hand domain-containing protein n=2 Tax=Aphanomyces astaci TaxID=112090 RepID=A0A397AAC8_APHAT|nr:hypothetical protein DYB36_004427 [Aphanomyces astaci]RLO14025.1 hypothetical protein DYB28_004600 [Aphanomyces astaci]
MESEGDGGHDIPIIHQHNHHGMTPPLLRAPSDGAILASFDTIFSIYDTGRGSIATEHLSALFHKMGYTVSRDQLEKFLDELDPDATGDISKLAFLKWFERWGDALDDPEEVAAHVADNTSPFHGDDDNGPACGSAAMAVQSEMLDAKMQRKRAEEDVHTEEKKAQRKIDEANKRAEDIESIKRRNAEHQRLKREHLERTSASVRHALVTNCMPWRWRSRSMFHMSVSSSCVAKMSVDLSKKKELAITTMVKSRAKYVQDTKLDAKLMAEERARQMELDRKRLAQKTQAIKDKEKEAAKLREEARKRHERVLVKAARTKLADEFKKKSVAEKMLRDMEAEEARLIEKLRHTQEHQRQAYMHLESAIQMQVSDD